MKVINKHPEYVKRLDRINKLNQAYTSVFRTINKIDTEQEYPVIQKRQK
jgi:hypothetical protein